jgi:hypothetical protein
MQNSFQDEQQVLLAVPLVRHHAVVDPSAEGEGSYEKEKVSDPGDCQ